MNWVQFKWRNHDPQIGRFVEIDPLSDKYVYNSTYAFSENKVTNDVELEGLESISAFFKTLLHSAGLRENTNSKEFLLQTASTLKDPATYENAIGIIGPVVGVGLIGLMTSGVGTTTVAAAELRSATVAIETSSSSSIPLSSSADRAVVSSLATTEIKSAPASTFTRLETISGNQSSATVGRMMNSIKSGEQLPAVQVAKIGEKSYILDGHHRLEASTRTGTNLPFQTVAPEKWPNFGYKSASEILNAAANASSEKVKLSGTIIGNYAQ